MTDEEKLKQALRELEEMKAEIAKIKALNVEDLVSNSRTSRGKDPNKQHGEVVIRAKNGIFQAGFERAPEAFSEKFEYGRTANPVGKKAQRKMLARLWKPRSFKRCGCCGSYDTHQSLAPEATEGVEVWCYTCGSVDAAVLAKYSKDEVACKPKPIDCVECGNQILILQGALLFPTGEVDHATGRKNYRCEPCHRKEDKKKE